MAAHVGKTITLGDDEEVGYKHAWQAKGRLVSVLHKDNGVNTEVEIAIIDEVKVNLLLPSRTPCHISGLVE